MNSSTKISTAARRIARESQDGRRIYFDSDGQVTCRIVGHDAYGPSQYAAYAPRKITQRAAQDMLDSRLVSGFGFVHPSEEAMVADIAAHDPEGEI